MTADPVAVALLTAFADELGIPRAVALGIGVGESGPDLNVHAVGDGGRSFGLLQVYRPLHGGTPDDWLGHEGARRSLDLVRDRWRRNRGILADWATLDAAGQVRQFAVYWREAQGAVWEDVERAAPAALARGRELADMKGADGMVVSDPGIKWYTPAHANGYTVGRPAGVVFEGIVYHTTAGGTTLAQLAAWFARPTTGAATWFGIDAQGRVGQFVSLLNTAHAHGLTNGIARATARLVQENYRLGARDPNTYLIGIELLDGGRPGDHTPAQLEGAAHLGAYLWERQIAPYAARTGAVVDREHILGHFEIDNKDRAGCPGWSEARFAEVIARIQAYLAPAPAPRPRPPAPPPAVDFRAAHVAELEGIVRSATDNLAALADVQTRLTIQRDDARAKLAALEE